jgi:signal transduction histidine kinase
MQEHRREVLREASVALQGRVVTLWEVSSRAEVIPIMTSAETSRSQDSRLDLDSTLHRWGSPIIQGSRWVGCRLDDTGPWCVAPVRKQPAAPPPDGVERRSRERITLELAGLCLGLVDQPPAVSRPRLPEPDALAELVRQPSVIAHEVANPLTAALASLDLSLDLIRTTESLAPAFRAELLQELAGVGEGMDQAIQFLRSIQDRARGGLARSERFDAAQVVRSCVALERPLASKRSVALQGVINVSDVFLRGDPNALYQVLTNLIRNAVSASLQSQQGNSPVLVTLGQVGEALRLAVQDHGVGIAGEHLERIFEPGFTTKAFGSGSGTGLTVVRQITQDMFGGAVKVDSAVGRGSTFEITLPIPVQRTPRERRQA